MNSLVIPVYKNEASIPALLEALGRLHSELRGGLEVVFVVDGSPDRSASLLQDELPKAPFRSELIELARNFGSFPAIRCGLALAGGPYFAVMAADLQEPPELVLDFFRCLSSEPVDVVCGQRIGRDDPMMSRLAAGLFWGSYRRLVQREIPPGGVDVFACNQAVRDALLLFDETNTSLVGQLFWLGFRRKYIPYQRRPRHGGGRSGWSFRRKLRYMIDSVFAFTDLPVNLLTWAGLAGMGICTVVFLVVLISRLTGAIQQLGYTPLMLMIAFSTSLNMFGAGILGGYVWRTYENTKRRPLALVMRQQSFNADGKLSPVGHDPTREQPTNSPEPLQ